MAEKKIRVRARVYSVVQYEFNPRTGEDLHFNEQVIKNAILNKETSLDNWAYIRHDKDKYVEGDDIPEGSKIGDVRPPHWHVLLKFKNQIEFSTIAKLFNVPENLVEKKTGAGAFFDYLYYMTHEDDKQRKLGKHVYERDEVEMINEVTANEMWEHVDIREDRRAKKLSKGETVEVFLDKLTSGKMTMKQVFERDSVVFAENATLFRRARRSYLKYAPTPLVRTNYHISGAGGTGKTLIAKSMARAMFPDKSDDEIFFVVGDGRVAFDEYDGQPIIIWDDFRAKELLNAFERGTMWKIFAIHPDKVSVHVKNGETTLINTVNIITSVEPFTEFVNGLAAAFKDNKSEDVGQAYRRFPIFIEVSKNNFKMFATLGLTGGEREQYEPLINIEVNTIELAKNQSKINNQKVFKNVISVHNKIVNVNSKNDEIKEIEHVEETTDFFNKIIIDENKGDKDV